MKVKNAIKKIVALGTGAVMLGATVMGAAAADLGDYPSPFVQNGVFSGKVVVGESAATSDLLGALDIATSLQRAATTPVSISGAGISVTDGETEEVPLGANVANGYLDTEYTDNDLSVLQDTSVRINGTNYDFHDEIQLSTSRTLTPQTSLSASEDDYEEDVYFELQRYALQYCLEFDESINLDLHLGSSSDNDEMEVDFLGANLRVTAIASNTSMTVIAGREVFLNAGDSTVAEGKTVTLDRTSNDAAVVTVDGQSKVIDEGDEYDFGGLNVQVDTVFNDEGIEYDSATVIVGADTEETFDNGDKFIGEPDEDYEWEWVLSGLYDEGTDQQICVRNTGDYEFDSGNEGPLGTGEYYTFPNSFVELGVESLTIGDDDYMDFEMDLEDQTDLSEAISTMTEVSTFIITVDEDEGILLESDNVTGASSDVQTDTVYLKLKDADEISIFYDNTDNDVVLFGNMTLAELGSDTYSESWGNINYDKTKATDMYFNFYGNTTSEDIWLGFIPTGTGITGDALHVLLGNDGTDFDALGNTSETEETAELLYGGSVSAVGTSTIGTKDENHRTKYGVIIEDPENNGANDDLVLSFPSDQVFANAVIRSGGAATGGGSGGTYDQVNPIGVGMGILDVNANLGGSTPYIVVGGPCANTVAAELLGNPANCAEGFEDGKAKVKWFDAQNALLVAGYSADDTVGASRVVADYDDYADGFAAGVTEFEVLVPTLVDLQIRTI